MQNRWNPMCLVSICLLYVEYAFIFKIIDLNLKTHLLEGRNKMSSTWQEWVRDKWPKAQMAEKNLYLWHMAEILHLYLWQIAKNISPQSGTWPKRRLAEITI